MAEPDKTSGQGAAAVPGKAAAPSEKPEAKAKKGKPVFVKAKLNGDYRGMRRAGSRFWLQDSNLFSKKWMEKADPTEEEKAKQEVADAAEALAEENEALKRENAKLQAELSAIKTK